MDDKMKTCISVCIIIILISFLTYGLTRKYYQDVETKIAVTVTECVELENNEYMVYFSSEEGGIIFKQKTATVYTKGETGILKVEAESKNAFTEYTIVNFTKTVECQTNS